VKPESSRRFRDTGEARFHVDAAVQNQPDISNNVGPVKHFLSRLRRSLRRVVFVVRFVLYFDDHGSFGSLSVGFGPT